jgi:CBS domain-containing protein
VRPLRRPDSRRLFAGQLVSFLGSQITHVAVPFHVYQLTNSSLAVGLLGLVEPGCGWTVRVRRHGWGVIAAATVWGVAITAFGLAGSRRTPARLQDFRPAGVDTGARRCYAGRMNVREVMTQVVLTAVEATTIGEAASLMAQRRVGSALVLEGERLLGIFTERDIVKALSQDGSATQQAIGHWMTSGPRTISPDATIDDALRLMMDGQFRHLPVVEHGRLVGMLSMRDIVRSRLGGADPPPRSPGGGSSTA